MAAAAGSAGIYDLLVGVHVASAVLGFGAVALSGAYGARARRANQPGAGEEVERYFRSQGWAEYLILAVPFLGVAALSIRPGRKGYTDVWVVSALLIWLVAAATLLLVVRPAERRIRQGAGDRYVTPGTRLMWSAALCDVLFVAALALMVTQPS